MGLWHCGLVPGLDLWVLLPKHSSQLSYEIVVTRTGPPTAVTCYPLSGTRQQTTCFSGRGGMPPSSLSSVIPAGHNLYPVGAATRGADWRSTRPWSVGVKQEAEACSIREGVGL